MLSIPSICERRSLTVALLIVLSFAIVSLSVRTTTGGVHTAQLVQLFASIVAGVMVVLGIETIMHDDAPARITHVRDVLPKQRSVRSGAYSIHPRTRPSRVIAAVQPPRWKA